MKDELERFRRLNPAVRLMLHLMGIVIGTVVGAFIFFQILFLSKVLPHGGL